MTSAYDLAGAFDAAGLLAPDYGGLCLDGVLPAAAAAVGSQDEHHEAARVRLGVPRASRVCVVLVDGLGHAMLSERRGHAPFLRGRLDDARVLTAGFPSTTATSMGLFGTGCAAGRTGLVGYSVRNPDTGGLANLVAWEGAGPAESWQREPSLFAQLAASGVEVTSVGPGRFAGSGLTEAALRGARFVAAEPLADRVDATLHELTAPGLVYLYWGEVDKVGHHEGWQSRAWADELTAADRELARLARSVPRDTLILITADHGMVDVDRRALVDVATTPALAAGVEVVAGEPRATHVHTRPGAGPEVVDRWRTTLGGAAVVATRDEAIASGWFGPVAEHVRPMIGDLVVAATGVAGIVDSRTQTPRSIALRGMHGSFTPGEMQVPLVVVA
ncbi:alkaline phosphatase family protein [Actinotalea sp. BY-33]|uniref:Alkaline phosphatase family protein n=1 Tax=Actinotalea soli TaxID=2819234 RepID=A0A939RS92_9CELL|nr:nucleotide pyrophosphatase/phosphodiesterase family protein [Actinotalea soli]MBO1750562.1 alkaline phosphatase family protein [Actinotalea soli]